MLFGAVFLAALVADQLSKWWILEVARLPEHLERLNDLDDLSNRLLRIVSGQLGTAATQGLRRDTILIARNLGPAELLEYLP